MIWDVTFDIVGQHSMCVPSVADTGGAAIEKARRMIPFGWKIQDIDAQSFGTCSEIIADNLRYTLNQAMRDFWAVAFRIADQHELFRHSAAYHDALDHYIETSKALWEV